MRAVWTLTGYEYKKIFMKRSTWIALGVVLLWTLFAGFGALIGDYVVEGEKVASHYQIIKQEREALEHLEIKKLNQELIEKARKDMEVFAENHKNLAYSWETEESRIEYWKNYHKEFAPYKNLDTLLSMMGNWLDEADMEAVDGTNFYEYRNRMMENIFEGEGLSEGEIAFHQKEGTKIKTPYAYGNALGFDNYFQMQMTNFTFLVCAVAIILAPMFAGEYTCGMDALILSSRYGKNKMIQAKLLTGISFGILAALGFSAVFLLEIQTIYGLSGWNLPIQVSMTGFYLNLPVNLLEFLGITTGCCILATCMTAMVVMFCSAKMKTAFGVIIVCFAFIFAPLFLLNIVVKFRFLYMLVLCLPTSMLYPGNVAAHQLLSVGNHYFYFFQWIPVVYLCLMAGLAFWSYRSFKNHQIR